MTKVHFEPIHGILRKPVVFNQFADILPSTKASNIAITKIGTDILLLYGLKTSNKAYRTQEKTEIEHLKLIKEMSNWIRCRDLSDEEMEYILFHCFPARDKEYWNKNKTEGTSYFKRRIIPDFSDSVQYPGELRAVVFICWGNRERYGGLLTQDNLNSLDEKLNAIGAGFEQ